MWNTAKAVLTGKLIALNVYIRKEDRSKPNNLRFHPRKLDKLEQIKSEVSRRKIIKIRIEINVIENKIKKESQKDKSWFSEKLDKISLSFYPGYDKKKTQIINIRNERRDITTYSIDIKKIIKEYFEEFYAINDNLDEMNQFLKRHTMPKLTYEEIGKLNRSD